MNFADYQAIEAINATALKAGTRSMKHMRHVMTGGAKEETDAMRWGSIVHKAILEPDEFFKCVAIHDGIRRGKEWDAFKALHAHAEDILKPSEHAKLFALSQAVHADQEAHRLITGTDHEMTITWEDQDYGGGKARLDGFSRRDGVIEIKTTSKITPSEFGKQFVSMGYDIQCGWYCEGAQLCGMSKEIPACHIIAIESAEPFDVVVYKVPEMVVNVGRSKARKIARRYRTCEAAGVFDGVAGGGIAELVLPPWYGENDVMDAFAEMSADELDI
jgi:hypothetical protein